MEKQISFEKELRKSLIFHAVTPCIILGIVCVIGFLTAAFLSKGSDNRLYLIECKTELENIFENYTKNIEDEAEDLCLKDFVSRADVRVEKIRRTLDFLNSCNVRARFYIFDSNLDIVYSTESSLRKREQLTYQVIANKANFTAESKAIYVYSQNEHNDEECSSYLIFRSIVKEGETEGLCGYELPMEEFKYLFNNPGNTVVLTNEFYRVIYSNSSQFMDDRNKLQKAVRDRHGTVFTDGKWLYISEEGVQAGGRELHIYVISDCSSYVNISIAILLMMFLLVIILTFAISVSAGKFAGQKTRIIYQLIEALEQVEEGKLDVRLDINSNDEFKFIGNSFNLMLGSIRHLIDRHDTMARENNLAIVQMMESQFNPHFLFNALESIRYMVKFDSDKAAKLLVSLSRLLRYSIHSNAYTVELSEEMDFTVRYMDIMKARFEDRLNFFYDIDTDTGHLSVPKMIIQPLIENAVKYGFGNDTETLNVQVSAYCEAGRLCIEVKDDGIGIEAELLLSLMTNLKKKSNNSNHIGLYNVHKRIELLYGEHYGLSVESVKSRGTRVILVLPRIDTGDGDVWHFDSGG